MFHWICPECGREIAPTVRECPACDPRAAVAVAVEDSAPPLASVSHGPTPAVPALYGGGHAGLNAYPEMAPNPLLVLARRLHDQRPATESTPVSGAPEPAAPETPPPVPASLAPDLPAVRLLASSAPVALLPPPEPAPIEPEPIKLEAIRLEPIRPQPLDAPKPVEEIDPPWATPLSLLAVAPVGAAAKTPAAPQPARPTPAPVTWNSLKERAAAPGPTLPLGVLEDNRASVLPKIQPAPPSRSVLIPDVGPRITLPGPALPPQLTSLEQAGLARILAPRPRQSAPQSARGWLVSGVVMLALVAAVIGILLVVTPLTPGKPQSPVPHGAVPHGAVPHAVPEAATPAPVITQPASYSLSKMVEVTGFRFVMDASKKPEVHYLVVNHSSSQLNDVTVFVTLRTTSAKPGQPPLCRFSFRPAGLAGYEAKEMVSPIQKLPPAAALPEWRDLYADVELGQ